MDKVGGSRIEVFIDSGAAEGGIALELFDVGFGPSSEGNEIAEGRGVVVVGVPELLGSYSWACFLAAHDGLPLVPRGVDGRYFSVGFDSVDGLG